MHRKCVYYKFVKNKYCTGDTVGVSVDCGGGATWQVIGGGGIDPSTQVRTHSPAIGYLPYLSAVSNLPAAGMSASTGRSS